jgi:hypothetical protein
MLFLFLINTNNHAHCMLSLVMARASFAENPGYGVVFHPPTNMNIAASGPFMIMTNQIDRVKNCQDFGGPRQ